MKINQQSIDETAVMVDLVRRIDNMNAEYASTISDEMFHQQPFFLTVLIGYRLDTSPEELEEIFRMYFLIWEHFKSCRNMQARKVTEAEYEKVQQRNLDMLCYAEGEENKQAKTKIFTSDLEHMKSHALLVAILYRFETRPVLLRMTEMTKAAVLIGIKTFINCFERLN